VIVFTSLLHKTSSRRSVVLVVDDEREVRELEQSMLEHAGYEVFAADAGAAALSIVGDGQGVDLVVADLMMPEMDGTEMMRRLRAVRPDLKVLFVTGYSDHLFEDQPWLWEGVAFLDKPFTMNGLLEAVSTLLSGRILHTAPTATTMTPRWFVPDAVDRAVSRDATGIGSKIDS
jgi:two-component system cell cycle sensor histidine kinase/response regulator CckA